MSPLHLLPAEADRRKVAERTIVEAWIGSQIAIDEAAGRSQDDFPTKNLSATVEATKGAIASRGLYAYQGGGNIFYHKSTPSGPVVVQARPFAQRVVRLVKPR